MAAINIQRGRDHGLPSYTNWRTPCGLSQIDNWADLEKVVGPRSTERIRQAYRSVDDVDLFVGGLAERPVIGGLVGPTFACIIAQQFSNLRKGDRFWYENPGFESSFTPAQLQSIRQVTLAQVLCRALGGGTLQPNVFLPPELPGNERLLCGSKQLGQLDLTPWIERDPFNKNSGVVQSPIIPLKPGVFSSTPFESIKAQSLDDKLSFNAQQQLDRKKNKTNEVNNKLDFTAGQLKPFKEKTTTVRTTSSANKRKPSKGQTSSNNKLDLTKKTASSSVTATATVKGNNRTRTKRPSIKKKRKTTTTNRRKDDFFGGEGRETNVFLNQDNATGYFGNRIVTNVETYNHDETTNYGDYETEEDDNDDDDDDADEDEETDTLDVTDLPNKINDVKQILLTTPSPNSYTIEINIRPNSNSYTGGRPTNGGGDQYHYQKPSGIFNSNSNVYRPQNSPTRPPPPSNYPGLSSTDDHHYRPSTPFSYDLTTERTQSWLENRYQPSTVTNTNNRPYWYDNDVTPTRRPELQTYYTVETTTRKRYRPTTTSYYNEPDIPVYTTPRPSSRPNSNSGGGGGGYQRQRLNTATKKKTNADEHKRTNVDDKLDGDDINDDDHQKVIQFDLDGYMRPDMHYVPTIRRNVTKYVYQENKLQRQTITMDMTETTTSPKPDGLTVLRERTNTKLDTNSRFTYIRPELGHIINYPDSQSRHPTVNIQSSDDFILDTSETKSGTTTTTGTGTGTVTRPAAKSNTNKIQFISMVPLTVLTKPERPDNWLIFDAPTKKPLPEMPSIESESGDKGYTTEVPKPIINFNQIKLNLLNSREGGDGNLTDPDDETDSEGNDKERDEDRRVN